MVMAVNGYVFQVERRSFCYIRCLASPLCLYSARLDRQCLLLRYTYSILLIRYAVSACYLPSTEISFSNGEARGPARRAQPRQSRCFHRCGNSRVQPRALSFPLSQCELLSGSRINIKRRHSKSLLLRLLRFQSYRVATRRFERRGEKRNERKDRRQFSLFSERRSIRNDRRIKV